MDGLDPAQWTPQLYITYKSEWRKLLECEDFLEKIPSLDSRPLEHFSHGQLVKFHAMIQDMRDPEYYFEKYSVKVNLTGETLARCGMYEDAATCSAENGESIDVDAETNKIAERNTCVAISIPGLNDWAKEKKIVDAAKASSGEKKSRRRNSEDEAMEIAQPLPKKEKKAQSDDPSARENHFFFSEEHFLNFPIPNKDGKACIVKIYDEFSCKLNDVVQVVGFISLDANRCLPEDEGNYAAEVQTREPPIRLVPRLHAVKFRVDDDNIPPSNSSIFPNAESIRSELRNALGQLLFGDYLAADYLICHLISNVYTRKDNLCLGNFPINVTNFPLAKYKSFAKDLYAFIAKIVPKSHLLEFTLDNLNDLNLVPKKDYDCDRLTSGILQLSKNTHLVIDETGLSSGRVTPMGKKNYEAVTEIIEFQKMSYDFKFFTMEYETDIPVLIISEVKSFIPCLTQIPLKIDEEIANVYPSVLEAASQYFRDEERLTKIRNYLAECRKCDFEISQELSEIIQQDFVTLRQTRRNFGPENLHSLIILARLTSLSFGKKILTVECWKNIVQMEIERVERLPKKNT